MLGKYVFRQQVRELADFQTSSQILPGPAVDTTLNLYSSHTENISRVIKTISGLHHVYPMRSHPQVLALLDVHLERLTV